MQAEMEEMRQALTANILKMFVHRAGEVPSRLGRLGERSHVGVAGKQALSYYDETKNQGNSQTVPSSRCRIPPNQADSGVDLCHTLNAKRSQGKGDLWAKLLARAETIGRTIFLARSEAGPRGPHRRHNSYRGTKPHSCPRLRECNPRRSSSPQSS